MKDNQCKNCLRDLGTPKLTDYNEWKARVDEAKTRVFPLNGQDIGKRIWCQIMDGEYKPMDLCNYCYALLRTVMQIEKLTFNRA